MNHGSLFSGIGGFDLAAEWMGWNNEFHCEWMPFPRKVLHHYWPNSKSYEDITKTDFSIHRGTIDILTGGFPCQPYSSAGKRLGKEDERHLWPHMLRAISEIKPTYVVGENVRGLTNWNGGMVFEEVCVDLESQGYEVQPVLLPACAVGAPHRRDRVWFIAYSNNTSAEHAIQTRGNMSTGQVNSRTSTNSDSIRQHECQCNNEEFTSEGRINALNDTNENDGQRNVTNSDGFRYECWKERESTESKSQSINKQPERRNEFCRANFEMFPTQSPICGGNDGLPTELDGITFSKWRNESIKGYGNAIVPQVAYQIFKTIQQLNDTIQTRILAASD
jgi:DNA (cytosine-5)-methyltransferase 1